MSLSEQVERSISALKLQDSDAAAVELARSYAEAIDSGEYELNDLGPKLLAVLNALGATPGSRRKRGGKAADVRELPDRLTLLQGEG